MVSSAIVTRVNGKADLKAFIRLPWGLYRDDPNWVPPLLVERHELLDEKKNPFFDHAEVALWLARRGDRPVGRISAQVDRAHLDAHGDGAGHFGLLEAEDEGETFAALLGTAEAWLKDRGMDKIVGPFSLSINDEAGLLVDGFDTPPMILMGHAKPYYARALEALGYAPAKDLICYRYPMPTLPPAVASFVEKVVAAENLVIRHINMRRFGDEILKVLDIFNDAWSDNWGYVPMSDAEISHMAKSLKPILRSESGVIAELDGEAVAMAVILPNINEAIADLNGRLLPFGLIKLLWRIKVRTPRTARLPLLGVRKRLHGTPLGAALA
ncbi:MAG: N-acetyltransferase, partial [Alphaproteobacteria bacterium]|nr:N-acetyltransferase [Alphaproteobacteria bacterium]